MLSSIYSKNSKYTYLRQYATFFFLIIKKFMHVSLNGEEKQRRRGWAETCSGARKYNTLTKTPSTTVRRTIKNQA